MEIYKIKSCDDDAGKLMTYSDEEYIKFQQNAHATHNFYTYGFKEMQIDKDGNRDMYLKLPIDSYILPIKQDAKSLVVINKIKPISTFPILTNQEYDNYGTIHTIQQQMGDKTIDIKFVAGSKNIVKYSTMVDDLSNTEIYHYICEIGKLFQNKFIWHAQHDDKK
jgi:hypothetical protein